MITIVLAKKFFIVLFHFFQTVSSDDPIEISEFAEHLQALHANDNCHFSEEYDVSVFMKWFLYTIIELWESNNTECRTGPSSNHWKYKATRKHPQEQICKHYFM